MKLYLSRTTSKKYLTTQELFNWHTSQSTQINSSIFQLRNLLEISQKINVENNTGSSYILRWCARARAHTHTHTHTHTRTTQTMIWNDLRALFQPLFLPVAKPYWNLEALSLNLRTGQFLTEWAWEKSLCSDLIFFSYKTLMMTCTHVPYRPP